MRTHFFATFATCLCLLDFVRIEAQNSQLANNSNLLVSITIFNKKDKIEYGFPNVYPSIQNLKIIIYDSTSRGDSISCNYRFPFLEIPSHSFQKIQTASVKTLSFLYDRVTPKSNNRFFLEIPIKFNLSLQKPLFIVIEQIKGNKFSFGERYEGATFIGGIVTSKLIY